MRPLAGDRRRGTAAAVLVALLCAAPARAAEAPERVEDYLTGNWYYTEVVVFQRPAVMEHATDEALVGRPAPLPRNLRSFRSDGPLSAEYPLYPATHAYLAFPYLDQRLLAPAPGAADPEGLDATSVPETPPADAAAAGRSAPAIRPALAPDPLLDVLEAVAAFEDELEARSYRWLPEDTFALTAMANRLRRSGGYQMLFHGRWLQPVPPREAPEALLIEARPQGPSGPLLQGTLDVTLGRFLHLNAHLYYREPLLGRAPVNRALSPATGDASTWNWQDQEPTGYMQLHQSRRMRSEELHYLDHPKLGVLVITQPVTPPESLSAAVEALEEGEQ